MQDQSHSGCSQSGLRTHKQQKSKNKHTTVATNQGEAEKRNLSGVVQHRAATSQESLHAKAVANPAFARLKAAANQKP
jgi:hypothetical protein